MSFDELFDKKLKDKKIFNRKPHRKANYVTDHRTCSHSFLPVELLQEIYFDFYDDNDLNPISSAEIKKRLGVHYATFEAIDYQIRVTYGADISVSRSSWDDYSSLILSIRLDKKAGILNF